MRTSHSFRHPIGTTHTPSLRWYAMAPTAVNTIRNDGPCIRVVSISPASLCNVLAPSSMAVSPPNFIPFFQYLNGHSMGFKVSQCYALTTN